MEEKKILAEGGGIEDDFIISIEEEGDEDSGSILYADSLSMGVSKNDAWIDFYYGDEEKFYKIRIKMSKKSLKELVELADIILNDREPVQLELDDFMD